MPENVLIIDNDQEASNAIAGALESEGFLVFTASRAETGLLMAKRIRPALLFLNLSVAGGIEFAKKLKAVETLKEVPFVLLLEGDAEYDPGYATMYGIMNCKPGRGRGQEQGAAEEKAGPGCPGRRRERGTAAFHGKKAGGRDA
jgi:CheY-like chemotaxis protein